VSPLLTALLGVFLVPLFVATWRMMLLGLVFQGLLMAWIAHGMGHTFDSANGVLLAFDLVAVRAVGAPLVLYRVLRARGAAPRDEVVPPNLLTWTLAAGFVIASFNFAELLVPEYGDQRTLVAVASAGLLLGFLLLATQPGPFAQVTGVLRIENAITLFELGGLIHHVSIAVQLAQVALLVAAVALYRWYLATLGAPIPAAPVLQGREEPTI
jgi:hydrogenase-4 membrane subunit HyfE